jgi:hypothetical protein
MVWREAAATAKGEVPGVVWPFSNESNASAMASPGTPPSVFLVVGFWVVGFFVVCSPSC